MSPEDYKAFIELVSRMRQAQKDYFSTRDQHDLNTSKALERQVDQFIDRANQPGLF